MSARVDVAEALKRAKTKAEREKWEKLLAFQLAASHVPFVQQYRFHESRKWRFDFAWPAWSIACEIDGGTWKTKSGHTSGIGFENDRQKDDAALRLGWIVYRCTPAMVKSGQALETITQLLRSKV